MRLRLECPLLALLLPLGVAADWVMEPLGDPPEGYIDPYVRDINDRGQVVGSVYRDGRYERVFVWEEGNWTILPTLGGTWAYATGLNERGQVVGVSETAEIAECYEGDGERECFYFARGFVWEHGQLQELGHAGFTSYAGGVNNAGTVVGWYEDASGQVGAVWDAAGRVTPLVGDLGGSVSPEAVNARGQVVGAAEFGTNDHAFVWDRRGGLTDLGTLGGPTSHATAINAWGKVTGYSETDVVRDCEETSCRYVYGAFTWEDGVLTRLPALGGVFVQPVDINDDGVVVGASDTDDVLFCHDDGTSCTFRYHAVVWLDGQLIDLVEGDQLGAAAGINNKWEIVGFVDSDPVIWRPVL